MKVLLIAILTLGVFGCSEPIEFEEEMALESTLTVPTHNATSRIDIKGMTCEIGCVRTVKSHLSKMNGVINIEMDFDTARTIDFTTVEFDKRLVSEADMKEEIESIANGIYSVENIAAQ